MASKSNVIRSGAIPLAQAELLPREVGGIRGILERLAAEQQAAQRDSSTTVTDSNGRVWNVADIDVCQHRGRYKVPSWRRPDGGVVCGVCHAAPRPREQATG